eukprot:1191563-Prorocentrum_minimum.AAC.3
MCKLKLHGLAPSGANTYGITPVLVAEHYLWLFGTLSCAAISASPKAAASDRSADNSTLYSSRSEAQHPLRHALAAPHPGRKKSPHEPLLDYHPPQTVAGRV